jgi:hypothetical protein
MELRTLHSDLLNSLLDLELHFLLLHDCLLLLVIDFSPQLACLELHVHAWVVAICDGKIVVRETATL